MLSVLSTVGLTGLLLFDGPTAALVSLVVIGLAYGAVIAAYPFAVTALFGPERAPAVYGRIFTAWGLAGLVGPWLAGAVFDVYGDYRPMLAGAATAGLASAVLAIALPPR